jgi:hypothetical protein
VVRQYLLALEGKEYADAYQHLTSESQSQHSLEAFRKAATPGGPVYDLDQVQVEEAAEEGQARVSVRYFEDPAEHGFLLKQEGGRWRIVFTAGSPATPRGR